MQVTFESTVASALMSVSKTEAAEAVADQDAAEEVVDAEVVEVGCCVCCVLFIGGVLRKLGVVVAPFDSPYLFCLSERCFLSPVTASAAGRVRARA